MNLHALAVGQISAVNPQVPANVRVSNGTYATAADGQRTPNYDLVEGVPAQVQSLTYKDLAQLDGINMNGVKRAIYLFGQYDGVVRPKLKGGDLIDIAVPLPNAGTWLVALVLESWPGCGWCKVAVTLQNDS